MTSRNARILLADSEAANLEILDLLLTTHGHRCTLAGSATEAWAWCQRERFDCLFLHASLGGTSGVALAERLTNAGDARPRHVVLMSGVPKSEFTRQLREGVVDSFLRKPVEPADLLAAVERCLAA